MIIEGHRNALESVDVTSIGVGGGAIARVDNRGMLRIGPESAGADPGPACYGKGGKQPTLTDADVVLGYIPTDYFLGGTIPLYKDLAIKAVEDYICKPLSLDTITAAYSIKSLAEENIAKEAFLKFVNTGYDPREFVLIVGGGAGPVHAAAIAEKLEMNQVYIPKNAGVFCPFGILLADYKYILTRFYNRSHNEINIDEVKYLYLDMEREGVNILKRQGIEEKEIKLIRGAAIRYFGQLHSIDIFLKEVQGEAFTEKTMEFLIYEFHEKHKDLYGYSDSSMPVTIEELKLHAFSKRRSFEINKKPLGKEDSSEAIKRTRQVFFERKKGFIDTPCYNSELLKPGNIINGPAIIEDIDTTVVVPENFKLSVDIYGNYIIRRY